MSSILKWLAAGLTLASWIAGADAASARDGASRVTARDLATLTDIEGLSVSPDKRWIAFQTRRAIPEANRYDQVWYVIPAKGGAPRRIADGGETVLYTVASPRYVHGQIIVPQPAWSPDSKWIVYLRQDNGRAQLWRSRIDGRRTEQLTHNESEMHGYNAASGRIASGFRFSTDGARLFFETRISEGQLEAALAEEGRAGFRFDDRFVPSVSSRPLAPLGAGLDMFGVSSNAAGTSTAKLWVYDFSRRRERPASEVEAAESAALAAAPAFPWGSDNVHGDVVASVGGALAWTEARDPELRGRRPPKTIVVRLVGAAESVVCEAAICTGQFVLDLQWHHDEELLFTVVSNDLKERVLYTWRPREDAPPRAILFTRGLYDDHWWNCAPAQKRLICFYEELSRPRRLVAIDLDGGAIETLYDPNPNWARLDLGPELQIIDVRLSSGARAPSYLVLPPDYRPGQRLPLVITTYVCAGFLRGGTGDEYPIFPLAAQGFAVLCHNHLQNDWDLEARRSLEEARKEQHAPGDPFQRRVQAGLDAAVAELDRMGVIDPERIGLTGLSQGGGTVKYALFNMPKLTAAIATDASSGSANFTMGSPSWRREYRRLFGIDSPLSPRLQTTSLARNADKVRAPFLVNVSDHEMLISVEAVAALEDAGRAVEMYVFPDEYHMKWQPAHRLAIYNRNIDWMNFWLRGVEDHDPVKAPQYERWRALRDKQCKLFTGANAPWYCRA